MVQYAMTLPAWQPSERGYWSPAESLAVDLVGLHEAAAAAVLGQARYKSVVSAMAAVFEKWASQWLQHAPGAAWFAHFLPYPYDFSGLSVCCRLSFSAKFRRASSSCRPST